MARKKPVNVRVSPKGDSVTIRIPSERMDELLRHLPECDLRESIAGGRIKAEIRRERIARDDRIRTILSPESLAIAGWEVIGTFEAGVFTAIRHGDLRLALVDGRYGWEMGTSGAFEYQSGDMHPVRDHFQVGVFCPKHRAYLLTDPIPDPQEAARKAAELQTEWRKWANLMPKGRQSWLHHGQGRHSLPEGARLHTASPPTAESAMCHSSDADPVVCGERGSPYASTYRCEAVLRPTFAMDEKWGRALIEGSRWAVGRRTDGRKGRSASPHGPLDGPYDLVMGSVWVGWTHPWRPNIGEVVGMRSEEQALTETRRLAAAMGIRNDEVEPVAA